MPIPDPQVEKKRQRIILEGDVPSPAEPPTGCNFNTRCPQVMDICHQLEPAFTDVGAGHYVACFLHDQVKPVDAESEPVAAAA